MIRSATLSIALLLPLLSFAQVGDHSGMAMAKPAAKPSTALTLTGLGGATKTLSPADFKALPHITVSVMNAHAGKQESYSGVAVKDLLAMVEPAKGEGPKVSSNMQIVIAGATDNFHVAITLCDTNPECRNGQAIVADTLDGAPLTGDGAFKLVLTEDKKPARWARNLESLTVKAAN
jgi:hypothetical protein